MMLIDMTPVFAPIGEAVLVLLAVAASAIAIDGIEWSTASQAFGRVRRFVGLGAGVRPARV